MGLLNHPLCDINSDQFKLRESGKLFERITCPATEIDQRTLGVGWYSVDQSVRHFTLQLGDFVIRWCRPRKLSSNLLFGAVSSDRHPGKRLKVFQEISISHQETANGLSPA